MPNDKSKKVMSRRKINYDRFSALIDKGGNKLLRVLAIREGVSIAEYIRRAVLARGGLHMVPYPDKLQELDNVTTQEEARKAVRMLQYDEMAGETRRMVLQLLEGERKRPFVWNADKEDIAEIRYVFNEINQAIDSADGEPVKFSERQIGSLQRMLANIEH